MERRRGAPRTSTRSPQPTAWTSKPFRRVWAAGAVGALGVEVGELALPILAVQALGASAGELSLLRAAMFAPFLLLTLWLGVLVDRRPRRPLLVLADLGRGAVVVVVCALALTGVLGFPILLVAMVVIGSLAVLAMLADFSLIPLVVDEEQLIDANARMTATHSAIGSAGAGVGGLFVQAVSAPIALLATGIAHLLSGLIMARTRIDEPPSPPERRPGLRDAVEGLRLLWRHRSLRALMLEAAIWNAGNEILMIALLVRILEQFPLGPLAIGLTLTAAGVGAVLGSLLSARLTARWGYGRSLLVAMLIGNTAPLAAVLSASPAATASLVVLIAGFAVSGVGIGVANAQAVSVRQQAVESAMRGRTNAGYRFVSWGATLVGALAAGGVVLIAGTRGAAVAGGAIMALATVPIALSPVRRARTIAEASSSGRA